MNATAASVLPRDEVITNFYLPTGHHLVLEVEYTWGETPERDRFELLAVRDMHGPWVPVGGCHGLARSVAAMAHPLVSERMREIRDGGL